MLQWNVKTLLLLMAVVGAWTGYFLTARDSERLGDEIQSMRELAGELNVTDPSQFAAIQRPAQWDEAWWESDDLYEVHLPSGSTYTLKLATHNIAASWASASVPDPAHQVSLPAGRHFVRLKKTRLGDRWDIRVELNGRIVIAAEESNDWKGDGSASGIGLDNRFTQQSPVTEPLILIGLQFFQGSEPPRIPSDGIYLWIESDSATSTIVDAMSR